MLAATVLIEMVGDHAVRASLECEWSYELRNSQRVEISEHAATVRLNRPDVRNAFHPSMIRDLTAAFAELARKAELSVCRFAR